MLVAAALLASVANMGAPAQAPGETPATVNVSLVRSVCDYFCGSWEGSGAFVRGARPLQSTYRIEPVLGGEVLRIQHAEKKPNSYAFDGLISFDPRAGGLVLLIASNGGGGARIFRSTGWLRDRLVFTADPALRASFALERLSLIRTQAGRFRARYEVSRDGATWGGGDEQSFVRR